MDKMINYIFGTLQASERAFVEIRKNFKKQNLINTSFALFSLSCAAYVMTANRQRANDIAKIESLQKEIEELKKMKGE